jgi:hypothetical protein
LASVGGVAGGLGLLCLMVARKPYLSSVARAADWSDAATETVVKID